MKIVNFISFIFLLTISCKENKNNEEGVGTEFNDRFTVTLDVEVSKPDTFSLYYTEDGSINFGTIPALWVDVEGRSGSQRVVFSLPKEAKPTQLRLDFGVNKEQEDIVFKQITLAYRDKKFSAAGPEIFTYFRPDSSKCKVNKSSGTITAIEKNGVRQTPSLYPHEDALGAQMKRLIN